MFQSVSEEVIRKALAMYTAKDTRYLKDAQIDKSDDTINLVANFSITIVVIRPRIQDILMP